MLRNQKRLQFVIPANPREQDGGEVKSRHLGHLKHHLPRMAHNLRRRAGKNPRTDWKNELQTYGAGRQSKASPKPPTLFVGQKSNEKSRLKVWLMPQSKFLSASARRMATDRCAASISTSIRVIRRRLLSAACDRKRKTEDL